MDPFEEFFGVSRVTRFQKGHSLSGDLLAYEEDEDAEVVGHRKNGCCLAIPPKLPGNIQV